MVIGEFIFEFIDEFGPFLLCIGSIDNSSADFHDEVPAGTQEFRISPGATDAISIAFKSTLIVADGVVGIEQGRGNELSDVPLDEPMPPTWLQDHMAPLRIPELEWIYRDRNVDRVM